MEKIAFFDMDGVLADDRHRVHHALERNWHEYFRAENMAKDAVWPQGRQMVENAIMTGWTVAYLTGRREDLRYVTELWQDIHGFPVGRMVMRKFGQRMPLANLKAEYLLRVVRTRPDSEVVLFDDDPEVIRVVRDTLGPQSAFHCTWHTKQKALVKQAIQ